MEINSLYCGDNLEILRSFESESIDLICTDPPFNTGRDWGAFNDKWEGGLKGYLKFMEERAVEMHRLLKDTGSLYLHCDPTASHYLKVMLDNVFGMKNFRNEIIWCYSRMSGNHKHFNRTHDVILFYTKEKSYTFNVDSVRGSYSAGSIAREGKKAMSKVSGKDGVCKLNELGKFPDDWWVMSMLASVAHERTGYPTQKPIKLYDKMIQASSNQGGLVLDPFCGSGTTLVDANQLARHYIGIDKNPDAIDIATERLQQTNLFTGV